MMKQSIKRMVLTGVAVTVMMGFTAPAAMAQEVREYMLRRSASAT